MKYLILSALILCGVNTYCQTQETFIDEVPFQVVENVPLYQGCDESMSNDGKRQCMRIKLLEFVNKNLDTSIALENNIHEVVRISVLFKIDTEGNIIDVQARGKYPELVEEAIRIVKGIPKMQKPGMQVGKPVIVHYTLPITFNVEGKREGVSNKTFPAYRGCDDELGYEALKKCTTEKIMDFVKVNATLDEADKLFPTDRSTQFQANFVIDKKGNIKDIKVKAFKRDMAVLVIRVLKRLPKMKSSGTLNGTPADTAFGFLMTLYFD